MTPEPQLEERLRSALDRPQGAAWPDERGAFDRFLRHRNRRGRILAGQAAVVMIVALALAVVTPRLLPGGSLPSVTPPGRSCGPQAAASSSPYRPAGRGSARAGWC
jgi:hypothetical protein